MPETRAQTKYVFLIMSHPITIACLLITVNKPQLMFSEGPEYITQDSGRDGDKHSCHEKTYRGLLAHLWDKIKEGF